MTLSHRISAGMVTLVSAAALTVAAAPAGAAPAKSQEAPASVGFKCSNSWKNAGSLPGKWSKVKDSTCSIFGNPKYKAAYQWAAERGSVCVKVKGFSKGKAKWYNAGCGKTGAIKNVPWGNVAAHKEMKVKGAALFKWR